MAQGQARFGGYESDQAYRRAIAAEIDARTAESASISKPLSASSFAQEAQGPTSDELIIQAASKLTQALSAHQADLGVGEAYGTLNAMIDGSADPESAALAVIAFSSQYPEYSASAVEAMDSTWGEWGREVLEDTVYRSVHAAAAQERDEMQQVIDGHIAGRAELLGGLSDEIARSDGERVRGVTAALASDDEGLFFESDTDATARLLGHREVAKEAEKAVGLQAWLSEFDQEVESRHAGRLHTDEERQTYRQKANAATEQMTTIDPETAFERGHAEGLQRIKEAATLPFDAQEFDAELEKFNAPSYKSPEAIAKRDAQERADHLQKFGTPLES